MDEARHLNWKKGIHGISIFPFHLILQRSEGSLFLSLKSTGRKRKKVEKREKREWKRV